MITRRAFLRFFTGVFGLGFATSAWAMIIEPFWRMRITRYAFTPAGWPDGLSLRLAIVADIHACNPWMTAARVREIAETTNDLGADCVLLLGDYVAGHKYQEPVPAGDWAKALSILKAPLGVHAVLGNHDWWNDREAMKRLAGPTVARLALESVGIRVYENDAARLEKDGRPFWLAGLGDQMAFIPVRGWRDPARGADDLPGALAKITDDAPVILMAHEPDVFARVPSRVALTISGHTHGGQVRLFGHALVVPSCYGERFAYGHVVEDGRDLVVSGGLGCSVFPVRLGSPPEIVVIELGGDPKTV